MKRVDSAYRNISLFDLDTKSSPFRALSVNVNGLSSSALSDLSSRAILSRIACSFLLYAFKLCLETFKMVDLNNGHSTILAVDENLLAQSGSLSIISSKIERKSLNAVY